MAANDRGYGHLAVCGRISCRETTKEMRAQNLRNAGQPACAHRRVLGGRIFSIRIHNHKLQIEFQEFD